MTGATSVSPPVALYDDDLDFALSRTLLRAQGIDLVHIKAASPAQRRGAVGLLCSFAPLTRPELDTFPALKVISLSATDSPYLDQLETARRGIVVTVAPDISTTQVAEHSVALILASVRRLPTLGVRVRADDWRAADLPLLSPSTLTLGLVGVGRIGARVAEMSATLFRGVLGYDIRPDVHMPHAVSVPFAQLLAQCDVLSLHVSTRPSAQPVLGRSALAAAKPGIIIVNTSRAAAIDEAALLDALTSGSVSFAALDILADRRSVIARALTQHPNVLVTPHCAYLSPESRRNYARRQAAAFADALRGVAEFAGHCWPAPTAGS